MIYVAFRRWSRDSGCECVRVDSSSYSYHLRNSFLKAHTFASVNFLVKTYMSGKFGD